MRIYIIRRLLLIPITLFIVSIIIFFLIRLIPGNIIDAEIAALKQQNIPIEDVEAVRAALVKEYGLDVPILTQYGRWIGVVPGADGSFSGILQGDLGTSLITGKPVLEEIVIRWPVTFELGLIAIIVAQLIALPIGIYSALRQDTWGDYISRSFAILCISIPGFWVATLVIVFPSIWWGYMPPIFLIPFTEDPIGNLRMFIVPAITLGMLMSGGTMRIIRTMMLEVLRQDYIRTAWGKGLRERVVVLRHALKNALIPVVTMLGPQLLLLLGGAVITEQIFCLPGIGRLSLDAIVNRDYPMVSGSLLIMSFAMVLLNLMIDLTYGFLDPRVHYK
ncbi:Glutathione transport system permease protein GsiC [subsurface metagenome]